MSIIMAATALVTAAIVFAVLLFSGFFGPKYVISFDPEDVSAENVSKFNQVKEMLKDEFYQDVDENTLLEGAVGGLAESLKDPYTVYFNKEQMQSFLEKSEGSYVGIGISVNTDENGILTVVEPMPESPAEAAGLKKGDKIVKVDDTDVTALKDENMIISMIKGTEGTKVIVTVYRSSEGKYIDYEMTRTRIKITNIKSEVLEGDIGFIKLSMFDSEISGYFEKHLDSLLQKGIKGLIIDLRDNPGGSYEQVVQIADRLLPEGLIVYTEDRDKNKQEKKSDKKELGIPLALLINGNSASASEILAGSIKDYKEGTLIGTKTFGKGLVQELKLLNDGSGIKVTVARYFTPSGVCIHGLGIEPDLKVEVGEEYIDYPASRIPRDKDEQLKSAIEAIKSDIAAAN